MKLPTVQIPTAQRQWHLLGRESIALRQVAVEMPKEGELLLGIDAATTCGTDLKVYRQGGHARMLTPPCPFGHEMAGTVLAVGARGRDSGGERVPFDVGQRLVIANSASCGRCLDCRRGRENLCADLQYLNGAFGQYLRIPARFVERSAYLVPTGLEPAIAALAEPLACAVHCLDRLPPIEDWAGDDASSSAPNAVVFGAGPLGLMLTGLLSLQGARVTVGDPNPPRLEIARRFGATATAVLERDSGQAEAALDAARAHLPDEDSGDGRGFDLAIDATGSPAVWQAALRSLRRGGHVAFFGGTAADARIDVEARFVHYSEITLHGVYHHRPASFRRALELLASKVRPFELLVSERRPLEELDHALGSMAKRRALKVAIEPPSR